MEELADRSGGQVCFSRDLPTAVTVRIEGEPDIASVDSTRRELEQVLVGTHLHVVFDFAALEFMDSSGLVLLIQIANRVGSIEVQHPTPIVRRILEVTGQAQTFGVAEQS